VTKDRLITRIGEVNAVLCELYRSVVTKRELYRSVVTKRELSNTVKLSVLKLIFIPILTYGHESWVMTDIISQVQYKRQRWDFCEEFMV